MFILDIYRHPEARVKVILHFPRGTAWITKSLHRILPIGCSLTMGLAGINENAYDIIIDQNSDVSNYAGYASHPIRPGEYSVGLLIRKNRYSGGPNIEYRLHLPRDLAPDAIQRNLV